ncbi:hypothetical protein H0H93_010907 [Arthromyces matolae]|nr:hypothetical protein H0H93_010907 [Arthromyces matolae]
MTALNAPAVDSPSHGCSTCLSVAQAISSLTAAVYANVEALSMTKEVLTSIDASRSATACAQGQCGSSPFSSYKILTDSFTSKIPSSYVKCEDIKSPITVFNKDGSFSSFNTGYGFTGSDVNPAALLVVDDVNPAALLAVEDNSNPTALPVVDNNAKSVDDDARSVKSHVSVSTDWEKEYGVDLSILQESLGNSVEARVAPAQRIPPEERCHNVAGNVGGIPNNALLGCESETAGRKIFEEALDEGRVVKVTMTTTEQVLSRSDTLSK